MPIIDLPGKNLSVRGLRFALNFRDKMLSPIFDNKEQGARWTPHNPLLLLVRPARFELATFRFVV
jgi:hypothetical protein